MAEERITVEINTNIARGWVDYHRDGEALVAVGHYVEETREGKVVRESSTELSRSVFV